MENNNMTENKKGFLQNDRRLVCSMFVFYGICILGLIAAAFWGLDRNRQATSANATATASNNATQQANATSTAIAHATELAQYEFIEHFDKVSGRWYVGQYERQYGDILIAIRDGVYVWDIADPKGFTQGTEFYKGNNIKDFDVYMDIKFVEATSTGTICSGLTFRKSPKGWDSGAYVFSICNDSHFEVHYYGENGWQAITNSEYLATIQRSDWNRIEVNARSDHFTFTINNIEVFEMTDDRQKEGGLGLYINTVENNSAIIWFDNFGYQSR